MKPIVSVIHGHFYQPPREDPWLGVVPEQPEAYPYHDWNDKIAAECYTANTVSRILDERGRIDDVTNNFGFMSFNLGPTLARWLEQNLPGTYARILKADRASAKFNLGHGNAIAQPYFHNILPLAAPRDRATLIHWGILDFRARFGRNPEGMWLPETAVNNPTLQALIEAGIRFTILAPHQAEAVRPLGDGDWQPCPDGADPGRPYRCFPFPGDRDRFIDLFFFDLGLAQKVGFGTLLNDARGFAGAVRAAAGEAHEPPLVNLVTDGETFGHHKRYGDMCLAYYFTRALADNRIEVLNYGAILDRYPPRWEAMLRNGGENTGTAWSCAHGVERWRSDCGCRTGGENGWHQRWRRPLREALDYLKTTIDGIYEREMLKLFAEPWRVLDDYHQVIFSLDPVAKGKFLGARARHHLTKPELTRALHLLEAEVNGLMMFTSCGWFFADLSGLEPVQNLKYASRAIELIEPCCPGGGERLLDRFLALLAQAPGNLPDYPDGRVVFDKLVRPHYFSMRKMVNCFAIAAVTGTPSNLLEAYNLSVRELEGQRQVLDGKYPARVGWVDCLDRVTLEAKRFAYHVTEFSPRDIRCYLRAVPDEPGYRALLRKLAQVQSPGVPLLFEGAPLSLDDLIPEIGQRVMLTLLNEPLGEVRRTFGDIFEKNRYLLNAFTRAGFHLPYEFTGIIRSSMSERVTAEFLIRRGDWDPAHHAGVRALIEEGHRYGVELDLTEIEKLLNGDLGAELQGLKDQVTPDRLQRLQGLLAVAKHIGAKLRTDLLENTVLEMLQERLMAPFRSGEGALPDATVAQLKLLLEFGSSINISPRQFGEAIATLQQR